MVTVLAVGATLLYTLALIWKSAGGRQWATVGKVLVFVVLIIAGFWALTGRSPESARENLTPFFPGGTFGVLQAMGYTFITLQGFDLIAAVGGEVRDPGRTIPKAMFCRWQQLSQSTFHSFLLLLLWGPRPVNPLHP